MNCVRTRTCITQWHNQRKLRWVHTQEGKETGRRENTATAGGLYRHQAAWVRLPWCLILARWGRASLSPSTVGGGLWALSVAKQGGWADLPMCICQSSNSWL